MIVKNTEKEPGVYALEIYGQAYEVHRMVHMLRNNYNATVESSEYSHDKGVHRLCVEMTITTTTRKG